MSSKFILTNVPFLLEDVQLASLVPDIRNPHQDALSALEVIKGVDFSVRDQRNLKVLLNSAESSFFRTHLTKLASLYHKGSENGRLELSTTEGRVYELKQPKSLFKKLCSMQTVRTWLQEGIEDGQETYFIVGFRTFLNAMTSEQKNYSSHASAQASVPVGEVVGGAAYPVLRDTLDIGLAAGVGKGSDTGEASEIPGERIYAICYRKIAFKMFRARQADTAFLESNLWKMVSDNRGHPEDEHEVVQADLGDIDEVSQAVSMVLKGDDDLEEYILLPDEGDPPSME
jgi:hypothetical protein